MSNFIDFYDKLNTEQKAAVDAIEGPVMVLAGPGTGKTQVLTMRIANILMKTDTIPDAILALTFTDSGVRAMRERLLSILGTTAYYINIHTFHSFASEIIQSNPDEFIISTQIEPLSDLERTHIFKQIFDELNLKAIKPFNAPYFYLKTAISKTQDLKREGIDIKEYSKYVKDELEQMEKKDYAKNLEFLEVYKLYQKKLKEYGRYDFEDMINFVTEKFKKSPSLLQKYQERFHYFLVDEFQDTNSAQAELLYQLNSYWDPNPNLFVVGDDDQSIYRFQGASIENIINFNEKYPNSVKFALKKNYRSVQPILDAAQKVIANNSNRISNKLNIAKNQKSQVNTDKIDTSKAISVGEFSSSHTENHYIAKGIKKAIAEGIKPSEIAVIYRNNADSIDIADMLSRMGIEYTLEGGENVLNSGIIIRLLHLLRVIFKVRSGGEDLEMFTLLNYEFLQMIPLDILKLSRFASNRKINFFEALQHADLVSSGVSDINILKDLFGKLVIWNKNSVNDTFIEFIEKIMEESGYINWILKQDNSYGLLNKLNSFLSEIKRLNYSNKNLNLGQFLEYIDLMAENGIPINEATIDIETNAVKLTTAHRSKGLEFEYVFIPKFLDKKWSNIINKNLIKLPSSMLKTIELIDEKDRKKRQEEDNRRLFFVVLTRAKSKVIITSAKNYQLSPFQKIGTQSMFLNEIPSEQITKINIDNYEKDASEILRQLLHPIPDIERSDDETNFLIQALRNFRISASSLNSYLECPYKFKLEYLFKTPQQKSRPLIMGSAVHSALEKAYKDLKLNQPVDANKLLKDFTEALKLELLNENEFKEIEEEGHSLLKIYHQTYINEFDIQISKQLLHMEKFFGWGFSRPLLDGRIHLQGKVDKIEIIDEKNREVKITDYKTGRPKSRNEILGKTKYADSNQYRQLLFYKLLIDLDKSFNYKVREVELDYIGHRNSAPRRESFLISEKDIESLSKTIREAADNIKNLKFHRTENYSNCTNCRFHYHCWPDGIPSTSNSQLELNISKSKLPLV